ncbi:MAG: hypothetical protein NZ518_08645, partial [Dehalococcoidia bacterium]|nr:hypothetical protein [Dehalococcoidia bacterium]
MTHAERSPIAGRSAARPVVHRSRVTTTGLLGLLLVSLFFTGMAGLMYQLVWFRLLGLIFGVTSHASSVVLAAFMGGLALGSFLASWFGPRLRNPIRAYGVAELAIGLFGFASLWAFDALQPIYRAVAIGVTDNLTVVSALRFVLAFAIMLIPTTMMGATLPFLLSAPAVRAHGLDRRVSLLYALNTFGA